MITALNGLPEGVIGFESTGKIAAEDYRDVVVPALEQAAKAGDVRFIIVMRDFDGITGGALWQDLKMGIEHLRSWKRIALVTDIPWMGHLTDLFGWMTPGETKTFPLDQQDQAIRWVAEINSRAPRSSSRSGGGPCGGGGTPCVRRPSDTTGTERDRHSNRARGWTARSA